MMQINKCNNMSLKGFTLLELLVAIALMDLIALTLYSSMYIGIKAKKSSTQALKPYRLVIPVFESLSEDLKSTLKPSGLFAGSFQGGKSTENESDSISFHCCNYHPEENEKASSLVKVEYVVEDDDLQNDSLVLVRKITTNLLSSKTVNTKDEVLCRGISSFNVEYYDGNDWTNSWDSTTRDNELPRAARISLSIADEDYSDTASKGNNKKKFTQTISLLRADDSTTENTNAGK
jgi:type II secretion system protein J